MCQFLSGFVFISRVPVSDLSPTGNSRADNMSETIQGNNFLEFSYNRLELGEVESAALLAPGVGL